MTALVGILNLTPDSFSDGGLHNAPEAARRRMLAMVEEGAGVVDIGAESTRPGATPLPPDEEWARLEPVLAAAKAQQVKFSIDTRHAQTVRRAAAYAPYWINDPSGFADPEMVTAVQELSCGLVMMHSLTLPADPKVTLPPEADPAAEVLAWADSRRAALKKTGIAPERLILDPGIGFGKTAEQSLQLAQRAARLKAAWGGRVLYGHSRKSFLALFTGRPAAERDVETYAVTACLALQGVDYLRVHDVTGNARILKVMQGLAVS